MATKLALCCATLAVLSVQSVRAIEYPEIIAGSVYKDSKFRLQVSRFESFSFPHAEIVDWPERPKVDENLVNQIDNIRESLPVWHGIHYVIGGAGSKSQ